MALYAFDGTWNKDKPGTEEDTNVAKFSEAYRSPGGAHYQPGVGTRFGHLGRLIGGITGAGARTRVERALAKARTNIGGGDTTVDIVGFSRGAALAVEFAYRLFREGGTKPAAIRFLGLWDCVPSFGIPGNEKNVGWHLNNVADNVGQCFHALALDERRGSFPLNRLAARVDTAGQTGRLFEVWFRGVHSDIGGGNRNAGLSDIALYWMMKSAMRAGVLLDPALVERARVGGKAETAISIHEHDPIADPFRIVKWNDCIHQSVVKCEDTRGRKHNNPPAGVQVVNDDGVVQPKRFGEA